MSQEQHELTYESTQRTVRTRDWTISYHEAGEGHPVILLHGSGPGAAGWVNFSANIGPLAEHFHVYAIDLPGWGASDPCTRDQFDPVGATLQFMDALGIDKAAIVGNSMGGGAALVIADDHPERISHLITMGAPTGFGPKLFSAGDGPTEGFKALVHAYRTPTPEAMRNLVEVMVYDKSYATEEICNERARLASSRPEHLTNFLDTLANGSTPFADLERLRGSKVPTLLIHGRDDRVVTYENSLILVAHIPNSRLVLLNRCGHWVMIEHADEFNRLVVDFVKNN